MCKNLFPLLSASDIECRVAQAGLGKNGAWASILLYKDARVDQRIMDDTFGPMNWQAEYELIDDRLYCKVSVWDSDKKCWITKMNVGTESNTEKEKGQASDALKRACFTWGLGVELYSSPKIFVNLNGNEYTVEEYNNRKTVKVSQGFKLIVDSIGYDENRKVVNLVLKDKGGVERYLYGSRPQNKPASTPVPTNQPKVFFSSDGKKVTKGGQTWQTAVAKAANGEEMDGIPIPIWFSDRYNIPDEDMRDFFEEVKRLQQ